MRVNSQHATGAFEGMANSYANVSVELSAWKRILLASRECRNRGNLVGAIALYRRGLSIAKDSGADSSDELTKFLAVELWSDNPKIAYVP